MSEDIKPASLDGEIKKALEVMGSKWFVGITEEQLTMDPNAMNFFKGVLRQQGCEEGLIVEIVEYIYKKDRSL
jgi:hypothetical protein